MCIRKSIIYLSLLVIVITFGFSYHYFSIAEQRVLTDDFLSSQNILKTTLTYINTNLEVLKKETKLLADLDLIKKNIQDKDEDLLSEMTATLSYFHKKLNIDVCYVMDKRGLVIASSNHDNSDSFVGKNYSFRPYFKEAIKGIPFIYVAFGVTSKQGGVYSSQPIYTEGGEKPIGVVVFKVSAGFLNNCFPLKKNSFFTINSTSGLVFITSKKEFKDKLLWKVSDAELKNINQSKQFGVKEWKWSGLVQKEENIVFDNSGHRFKIHQLDLEGLPDWQITYFRSYDSLVKNVFGKDLKNTIISVIVICLIMFILVFYLFVSAQNDLKERKKAEEERELVIVDLKRALDEINALRGIIPLCCSCKKMRDDEGYWHQVEYYIKKHSIADVSHGICPDCTKKLYPEIFEKMQKKKQGNIE